MSFYSQGSSSETSTISEVSTVFSGKCQKYAASPQPHPVAPPPRNPSVLSSGNGDALVMFTPSPATQPQSEEHVVATDAALLSFGNIVMEDSMPTMTSGTGSVSVGRHGRRAMGSLAASDPAVHEVSISVYDPEHEQRTCRVQTTAFDVDSDWVTPAMLAPPHTQMVWGSAAASWSTSIVSPRGYPTPMSPRTTDTPLSPVDSHASLPRRRPRHHALPARTASSVSSPTEEDAHTWVAARVRGREWSGLPDNYTLDGSTNTSLMGSALEASWR